MLTDRFTFGSDGEEIIIGDLFVNASFELEFADGQRMSLQRLLGTSYYSTVDRTLTIPGGLLSGGAAGDRLEVSGGGSTVFAGRGDDLVTMRGGHNRYVFHCGDGRDRLTSEGTVAQPDLIVLRDSIVPAEVALAKVGNDLRIEVGTGLDEILVVDYYLGGVSIQIDFENGTSLGTGEIAAVTGVTPPPTRQANISELGGSVFLSGGNDVAVGKGGDDTIWAGGGDDAIDGGAGDDFLLGEAGDDTLRGGQGSDRLRGGLGADIYEFFPGDGADIIFLEEMTPVGQADRIRLRGVTPAAVQVVRMPAPLYGGASTAADYLLLTRTDGSGEVAIANFFDPAKKADIAEVEFDDGTRWNAAQLESMALTVVGTPNQFQGTSGDDLYVLDHWNDQVIEAVDGGTDTVRTPVTYLADPNVERVELTGSLAFTLIGNDLPNMLVGNPGTNGLYGGPGDDTLIGGAGDDTYIVKYHEGNDTIVETTDGGIDTLITGWSAVLPENVENLVAGQVGSMPAGPARLTGNAMDNRIDGRSLGNIALILDGGAGADVMIGGTYETTFFVDNAQDTVIAVRGTNTVESSVSFTLPSGVQNLFLSGAAQFGIGNDADNLMYGWWDGKAQAVTLRGGGGNDRYVVGAGDTVIEEANAGNDAVVFSYQAPQFSAQDYANVENLELDGLAGAANLLGNSGDNRLSGNYRSNVIDGGAGNDVLIDNIEWGASGSDNDTLSGGDGNDELYSRSGSDLLDGGPGDDRIVLDQYSNFPQIAFAAGAGNDTVEASILGAGQTSSVQLNFGSGLSSERVQFTMGGADLRIGFEGTSDSLTLKQYNQPTAFGARGLILHFADGVQLGKVHIQIALSDTDGVTLGNGNDFARGTSAADSLDGLAGDDVLLGGAGDDVLLGGDGADHLFGGDGNDSLAGGTGSDRLYGNEGGDQLDGGGGDDTIDGGPGNDILIGGTGNDTFRDVGGASTYRYGSGFGQDLIQDGTGPTQSPVVDVIEFDSSIDNNNVMVSMAGNALLIRVNGTSDQITVQGFDWSAGSAAGTLEEVRFADGTVWNHATLVQLASTITGTEAADILSAAGSSAGVQIYGLGGNDTLYGALGDDLLDGGAGADTMLGGAGNDRYIVDNASDVTTENANEGTDTVESNVTRTLGANFENLTLTGTSAINGTGNTLANVLVGNTANNTLSGGSGADTMSGGPGNDTYVVDNPGDLVTENADEGVDLVQSSVNYTLGANVENMILTGSSGLSGTGNELANVLTGNSGANTLTGGDGGDTLDGGAGNDTMFGGAGNDVYIVGSTGDVVTENTGEGVDLVRSSVTYTLGDNVENLTLTGTSAINGTGNALDNVIIGNSGNNTLTGGGGNDRLDGGSGTDTLRGGTGDDTYVLNASTGKTLAENANEGADTVESAVTYTLLANFEHLTLTGTSAVNGTGNAAANHLRGNSANNTLNGAGGNDVLQGAAGNDTVTDTSGNNVLDGGDGTDALAGGTGKGFVVGGAGNDTLTLGGGADIIAFNRGHGADSDTAPTSGAGLNETNDTVSLGGVAYADLRLARSGNDLFVKFAGTADSLKFTGWYAAAGNRTTTTLQVIVDSTADYDAGSADQLVNRRVVRLNFTSLVNAFNTVYAGDPAIGDWAIPTATLNTAYLAGSDTQALGGDLAYRYGRDGNFSALDFAAASAVLGDANFATAAQTFSASPTSGGVRLLGIGVAEDRATIDVLGSKRTQDERLALAESWASSVTPAAGAESSYLTIEAISAASGSSGQTAPWAAGSEGGSILGALGDGADGTWLFQYPDAGVLRAPMRQRWTDIDAALARIEAGTLAALGGEAIEARMPAGSVLHAAALAAATIARPRQPSGRPIC